MAVSSVGVLADRDASSAADRKVVWRPQHLFVPGFEEEDKRASRLRWDVAPHLPEGSIPTRCRRHVNRAISKPCAFETRKCCGALCLTTLINGKVIGGGGNRIRVIDGNPLTRKGIANPLALTGIEAWFGIDHQHFKLATLLEAAAVVRDEAIEAGGLAVFGEVENACAWVDGDGFMHKASKSLEWHGLDGDVELAWDFEDIAVFFGKAAKWAIRGLPYCCAEDRFLTREPAAPWRRATRTVGVRPCEADEVSLQQPRYGVDNDGRTSRRRRVVVRIRIAGIHNTLAVGDMVTGDFMVSNDADIAIRTCEGCHTIVL